VLKVTPGVVRPRIGPGEICEWLVVLVVVAIAIRPIVALARIFGGRVRYPMDLDWCEGGSLYMAYRLLHHLPIYVRPGDVFAPFPYPPAHTLALALAGLVSGRLDYVQGRGVSIICFGIMCGAIAWSVRQAFDTRVGGVVAALLSTSLIACTFPVTGGWYDLVRVDSMMMAFSVLAAALIAAPQPGLLRTIAAAATLTVAVYTKQTAAFFAVWICIFATVRSWREGLRLTVISLLFCSVTLAALHLMTRGQFWFWIFENLTAHPMHAHEARKAVDVVVHSSPYVLALPVALIALLWTGRIRQAAWLWLGLLIAALPASILPYAKDGGWLNDLIPILVLIVPASLMAAADLLRGRDRWVPVARVALLASAAAFIWSKPVTADHYVPDANLWRAAEGLNARVASLPGGVLVPQLAFTPARNGQTNPHWHRMGHADLAWSGRPLDEDWVVVRAQTRWALLNANDRGDFGRVIRRRYRLVANLPPDERVHMLTGGGVVDLNQIWERLPQPGSAP
jgi:hypothetical protein